MLQLIFSLLVYILIISIIFANISFKSLLGIILFSIITLILICVCTHQIKLIRKKNEPQVNFEKKENEADKLIYYQRKFAEILRSKKFDNPFQKYQEELDILVSRMIMKNNQLQSLLLETFSPEDLTYITYRDSFDKILKFYNNNFKKIIKRISVFDFFAYKEDPNDEVSNTYLKETQELINVNSMVLDKVDKLLLELVTLDDVSNFSLNSIDQLIEQTKSYQKLYEDD